MNLNVNQVMKVVIDATVIPQMAKELEFYKRAYDNARDVMEDHGHRIPKYICSICFAYAGFCDICENIVCGECDDVYVFKCKKCDNKVCDLCRLKDKLCEKCYDQK